MVRDLQPSDMPRLAQLYKLFWNEESDPDAMVQRLESLKDNPDYIFLGYAAENAPLAGTVTGIVCYELYGTCQPFLVLENLIVDPALRQKGVGRSLVRALEARAARRGCTQIILVTEKSRADARGFYETMGFSTNNTGYKKKIHAAPAAE